MSKTLCAILCVSALLRLACTLHADPAESYAVQANAVVNADPPRIELSWVAEPQPTIGYAVQRKSLTDTAWGAPVALGSDATGFIDEKVELGHTYEYQIVKLGAGFAGYGYIAVGINAPLVEARGKVILVVDRSIADPLTAKLDRLQDDLAGDGWTVIRKDVARDGDPAAIRTAIRTEYEADRDHVVAVFLFGHIPIVRAGNLNIDGHLARPLPADVFYGEMNGTWTDNDNDGVLDQSLLPSDVELEVGRVDFADMPGTFGGMSHPFPSEVDLLARYLDKDHAFRHVEIRPTARALIGDLTEDAGGQAYAASGYRNFAALVGAAKITKAGVTTSTPEDERWIAKLGAADYLWAYGSGGGDSFSASGLGTHGEYIDVWSSDFLDYKAKGTFYLMFGSWFGEWSRPDDLLRAALTTPDYGLAAAWSGRPHLFFHTMGIGETLGHGIRLSQNNDGKLYQNQVQRQLRGIHIALMGDPTLRMFQLAPAREVAAAPDGNRIALTWKASNDPVLGYYVYRGASTRGPFTRISDALATDTRFTDPQPSADAPVYMVRAVALQASTSGSFYNASQGVFASVGGAVATAAPSHTSDSANGTKPADVVWVDDALPNGAVGYATANDRWNWVAANPAPFSGTLAHQADLASGLHHHFFVGSATTLTIGAGDTLFAYVYLDPANPPRTIMLTWCTGNWEHRAYWGDNLTTEGVDGSAGRRYIGPLPAAGSWVRLEVPASAVDLENREVIGMGFTLFDGRVTWDRAGKSRP